MWNKGVLEGRKGYIKFLILIGTAFLLTLIVNVVLMLVGSLFASFKSIPLTEYLQTVGFMKGLQLFSTLTMFFFPAVLIAYWSSRDVKSFLSIRFEARYVLYLIIILSVVVLQPFLNLMAGWFTGWHFPSWLAWFDRWVDDLNNQNAELLKKFLCVHSLDALFFNIVLMAVVPAVSEEFFFRGAVQRLFLGKLNIHLSVWITAAIFSLAHLEFTGFVPRMVLGAYFGYLLYFTGSIWVPVAAHFLNNFISVVVSYLVFNKITDVDINHLGLGDTAWVGWLGLLLFVLMLFLIRYDLKHNHLKNR
jgi:uncharacterized protein